MGGRCRGSVPVVGAVALAVVVAVTACTPQLRRPVGRPLGEVRIGLLASLSGPTGATGRDARRGAELAVSVLNNPASAPAVQVGGTVGRSAAKLQLVVGDLGTTADQAETQAVRMATVGRITGLVGVGDTSLLAAASERTERLHVPFVASGATADYLTERGLDWFFRTGPTDRMLGQVMLSMLSQQLDPEARRLGLLHTDDDIGNDVATVITSLASEANNTPTTVRATPQGATDTRSAAQQLRASTPDAVVAAAQRPADAANLLRGLRSVGYHPQVLAGIGAGFTPPVVQAAGDLGVLRVGAWSADLAARSPATTALLAQYQRRYGTPMSEPAADAFTAVVVLATAIGQAGAVDPQQVRAALLGLALPSQATIMPWNGVRFDQTGQNILAAGIVEQLRGGRLQVVFPRELTDAT
jgi:branched-chain amino acid transport system substrate-binding protein